MFKMNFYSSILRSKSSLLKKMTLSSITAYTIYKYSASIKSLSLEEEYQKVLLAGFENLEDGQMKEFKYAEGKDKSILITKYEGKLRAVSNYCPHFGAPLHTGVMIDRVVKCPWHGASFDVVTGKTDISPALDDLTTFEVIEENGQFYVKLPKDLTKLKNQKTAKMAKRDSNDQRKIVIVGAGAAGLSAAETLRQAGYTGEVILVSQEESLPYDRTMLTKWVPPKVDGIALRGKEFFEEYDIKINYNSIVTKVNNNDKTVTLNDGTVLNYDKLLIATGSRPVLPNVEGLDKANKNVFLIRNYNETKRMLDTVPTKKDIVIVGGSFISMEAASLIKKANKDANVTVIVKSKSPFLKELGEQVGNVLKKLHEDNGVKFVTEEELNQVVPNNSSEVQNLKLKNGELLPCDLLVFGTGVKPNTEIVSDIVTMEKDHIKSNLFMNTSDSNIFCAGDVASVPFMHTGKRYSYGHWVNAQQQGAIAALNMLDENVAYDYVPYYWTRMWDKTLQFTGNGSDFDEVFVDGDLSKYTFVAYYFKNGKVVGCASMNTSNAVNIIYEGFKANLLPRGSLIKDGTVNLESIKETVSKTKNKCSRSTCVCMKNKKI
jgi:NADPH-dependent 2,4-dienoyl-CoA reductase/sulfur reductase-like enzyme/nitrite reductase/ring-hydroxylating ferredoxin subunit